MRNSYFYLLMLILSSILVYGVDQSLPAIVTVNQIPGFLNVSPDNLVINVPPLSLVEKNLNFLQESDEDLDVTLFLEISAIKNWISFSKNNFILKPNEIEEIITFIDIPEITPGTFSGNIHAITNKSQDLVIPVTITVTKNYKISLSIDAIEKTVQPGESVSVLTELTKTKKRRKDPEAEGIITVNLNYNVFKGKNLITTLSTNIDVVDITTDTIQIPIPIDAPSGRYSVEVTATHVDKTAKDRDSFRVGSSPSLIRTFLNFLGFG